MRTTEELAQALECVITAGDDLYRESAARLRDLERKLGELEVRWDNATKQFLKVQAELTAAESALAAYKVQFDAACQAIGLSPYSSQPLSAAITAALVSARAQERERCAKECRDRADEILLPFYVYSDEDKARMDEDEKCARRIEALEDAP